MSYLSSNSTLAVQRNLINDQHRMIIDYINKLHPIKASKNIDKLKELVDYSLNHFDFEEKLMENENYCFLTVHKQVHKYFRGRLETYKQKLDKGEIMSIEHKEELKCLLLNHIKKDDMKLLVLFLK